MSSRLSADQQQFLDDLLSWDERRRTAELVATQVSLVLGGLLISTVAILTLADLRDVTVFTVLLPGFLAGVFLIAVYLAGRTRIRDRHRLATLARELTSAPDTRLELTR